MLEKINLKDRVSVFDKPGTVDRYTVLIDGDAYGMSEYPTDPRGFNQYIGRAAEMKDKGKKLAEIPEILTAAILERLGKQQLKKYNSGRKVLLGQGEDGEAYFLAFPSWDCGWYWGFGYVQSRDSHQHIDSSVLGDKKADDGGYCHNPYDSKFFKLTTFSEAEGWELGELFKQFYTMKETAEFFHTGGAHVTTAKIQNWKNKSWEDKINKKIIPVITARILEILTPAEKTKR